MSYHFPTLLYRQATACASTRQETAVSAFNYSCMASFSEWSLERFEGYFEGPERKEGSYVVIKDGGIVAATFASVQEGDAGVGRLDSVVNHPNHSRKGLGRVVCAAVLRHLADLGYDSTVLFTDDWRLPVIGLYLSLRFAPRMAEQDMPDRWDAIMQRLKSSRQ